MAETNIEQSSSTKNIFQISDNSFALLLTLAFLTVSLIGLFNHELWRDELHDWMTSYDSNSLKELYFNSRYDGHPIGWFLSLYILTRFSHNPIGMQLLNLLFSTSSIFLIARYSRFPRLSKMLFAFGYFPFFEYSLLCRSYAMGILGVFAFCALYPTRTRSYLPLALALVWMANTNSYGLIFSFALTLGLIAEHIFKQAPFKYSDRIKDIAISTVIFIGGLILSVWWMFPPADSSQTSSIASRLNLDWLQRAITTIWTVYLPVPVLTQYNFWNSNFFTDQDLFIGPLHIVTNHIALVFAIIMPIAVIIALLRRPVALVIYASGMLAMFAFIFLIYYGGMRHAGHMFILLIASLWIAGYYSDSRLTGSLKELNNRIWQPGKKLFALFLAIHMLAGFFAYRMDMLFPFSANMATAQYIRDQQLENMMIIGNADINTSGIAAFLDRKFYYLETESYGRFVFFSTKRKELNSQQFLEKLILLADRESRDILLILNYPLTIKQGDNERPIMSVGLTPHMQLSQLTSFTDSIIPDEQFYLYTIKHH